MNDLEAAEAVHRENLAKLDITPRRQFLARRKILKYARRSYALVAGEGGTPTRPSTAPRAWRAWRSTPWRLNDWNDTWTWKLHTAIWGGLPVAALTITVSLIALIPGKAPFKLPQGVTQSGMTFTIKDGFGTKTEGLNYDEMCASLPGGEYDWDVKSVKAGPDGTLILRCRFDG